MVKYKQLYHNIKDKIINEKKKHILTFFQNHRRKKGLGEEYYKKGGNMNGIKDSENGIS